MAKFLIHSCRKREWYVDNFLVPSMQEQGISADDILIYIDNGTGNLPAFVDSCRSSLEHFKDADAIWHLQDDVLICSDFAKRVNELEPFKLVGGFTCGFDLNTDGGLFKVGEEKNWLSFPCIKIPTNIQKHFVEWTDPNLWKNPYFKEYVQRKNGDDFVFREFLIYYYKDEDFLNVTPNLVEHVDYLLGGSTVSPVRRKPTPTRSLYFQDKHLVDGLKEKLAKADKNA